MYEIKQRLWLNKDKSAVVADGDPSAAFLYATEGHFVTDEEAKRFGLESIALPTDDETDGEVEQKATRPTANKSE
jgi:enoyl-CoA hydratase/carnithine racemase